MLVRGIREKGTNFKTDEPEDTFIEIYIISLKMMNKDINHSDNELTLLESSET